METTALTHLLRAAPLVELERHVVVTSPRRARRQLVRRTAVVVLAVGVTAASGVAFFGGSGAKHPSSSLGFRDVHEQRRFVVSELSRLEPPTVFAVQTAPRFVGHGLL